jgi:hypothetical protein
MPATLEEVQRVIKEAFPASDVSAITEQNHRIGGIIVDEEFRKLDSRQRMNLVTKRVRDRLGLRGINVGLLFALAPGEKL